jgi:hypothetical protein
MKTIQNQQFVRDIRRTVDNARLAPQNTRRRSVWRQRTARRVRATGGAVSREAHLAAVLDAMLASGILTAASAPAAAEQTNFLKLSPPTVPTIVAGTVRHVAGGPAAPTSPPLPTPPGPLPPRVIIVVSKGCTLMGVAQAYLAAVNAIVNAAAVPPETPLTQLELARALLGYNRTLLGYTVPAAAAAAPAGPPREPGTPAASHARNLPRWNTGLLLTLPIEQQQTPPKWVSQLTAIRAAIGTLAAADDVALKEGAEDLSILSLGGSDTKSPTDIQAAETAIKARLAAAPTIAVLVDFVRSVMLTNPYERVFEIIELFRQLRLGPPNIPAAASRRKDMVAFVVALMESLADHEAATVAQTTAGNAILRQSQFVLEDADLQTASVPVFTPAATLATRKKLAEALGLVPADALTPHATWQSPRAYGPTVVPQEPPITASQQLRTAGMIYLSHIALGRRLDISAAKVGSGPTFASTLSHPGAARFRAINWYHDHEADADIDRAFVSALAAAPGDYTAVNVTQAGVRDRFRLTTRISGTEGGFDSTQLGDGGLVSFGIQQWAAHVNNELTVLWERFRAAYPEYFDLFFTMAGLQVKRAADGAHSVDDSNPYGPAPETITGDAVYFPTFASFFNLAPGVVESPLPPLTIVHNPPVAGPRWNFFRAKPRDWCARARLLALCSHDYLRMQLQQAAWRVTRIEHETEKNAFKPHPQLFVPVPAAPIVTTLSAALTAPASPPTAAQLTIHLTADLKWRADTLVLCEREVMRVTGGSGLSRKVERGYGGTTAAAHATLSRIRQVHGYAVLDTLLLAGATTLQVKAGSLALDGRQTLRLLCGAEMLACTQRAGTTFTVVRHIEGTAAAQHDPGAILFRVDGETVLAAPVTAPTAAVPATQITVVDGTFLPTAGSFLLRCDDEMLLCTSRAGNVLTVDRGAEHSTAADHDAGATIYRLAGLAELFVADFAAGGLLDLHINAPALATAAVRRAVARTPGDTHDPATGLVLEAWLRRFGLNFYIERLEHWSKGPERNPKLIALHNERPNEPGEVNFELSPEPAGFKGWERST